MITLCGQILVSRTDDETPHPTRRVSIQNAPRVHFKNVPVCTGTTRTCVSTCARGAGTHGHVLSGHTEFSRCHTTHTTPHTTPHTHTHYNTRHNTTQQHDRNTTQRQRQRQRKKTGTERDRERQREKERDREKTEKEGQDKTRRYKTRQEKRRRYKTR